MFELLQRALLPAALHRHTVYRLATVVQGEGNVFRYLAEIRQAQLQGATELRRRADIKLANLLTHAAARSEFHRERLGSFGEFSPANARERVMELPFMTKRDVQEYAPQIRVPLQNQRVIRKSTGGSTGEPLAITKDADGVALEMAVSWLALEWFGISSGDRVARFWGTPLTTPRRVRFALTDLAMNRIRLSAFDLSEADLNAYWNRCVRFRPKWLYGYGTLIHMFAQWIETTGRDGTLLGLRAIVPTSEPIDETQRRDIERIFRAPVQNEYGCGEVGALAYDCQFGRLHLMTESVLVELITDDGRIAGPGEIGEVVVTDLVNRSMPLIRYRLGDRAMCGEPCQCGRPFPTLGPVHGRVHDVVYTPRGQRWHGEKIDYLMSSLFQETRGFRQYQVVQTGPDELDVRLVSNGPISDELKMRIESYVRERLDGMRVTVRRVPSTERSPNGKLRLVRNDWLEGAPSDAEATAAPVNRP